VSDYKKIVAWQRSHELTLSIYKLTKIFPDDEKFGMTSQVRRAAASVPSNIAEGSGRGTQKDFLRFLYIALGSLKETEYFLLLAHDLDIIGDSEYDQQLELLHGPFAPLNGLIKSVDKKVNPIGRVTAKLIAFISLTMAHMEPGIH